MFQSSLRSRDSALLSHLVSARHRSIRAVSAVSASFSRLKINLRNNECFQRLFKSSSSTNYRKYQRAANKRRKRAAGERLRVVRKQVPMGGEGWPKVRDWRAFKSREQCSRALARKDASQVEGISVLRWRRV